MTREEFNTYLKDWQVWRIDPNRKLPSKLFDRQRRKAYTSDRSVRIAMNLHRR